MGSSVLYMLLVVAAAALTLCSSFPVINTTALDDYVNKPDPTYKYEDTGMKLKLDGYTAYYINLTSQTWLTANDVDRSVWWHYLVINVPDDIQFPDTGMVYITGGSNTDGPPDVDGTEMFLTGLLAITTGAVTAALYQVPNEPIVFNNDPIQKRRGEDAIIAFTWYQFIQSQGKDTEYLLYLPMTKAAVRAMDTVTDFMKKMNSTVNIQKYMVAGASKRGWTTWTTGAVDKRVIGIAPIVMDLLNMVKNLHHHYRSLGGWTFAFKDYMDMNITADLDNPLTQGIADIVDPYVYIDRLTMPKFITCTSGDEFFLNDDSFFFWNDLKGVKFIRTIPNCEHSVAGHALSLALDIRAFFLSVVKGAKLPELQWTITRESDHGTVTLISDTKPSNVVIHHATTIQEDRRDFRLLIQGPEGKPIVQPVLWATEDITNQLNETTPGSYQYHAVMETPKVGWRGFYIQAAFPGPDDSVLEVTTQVNIIPDTFPYPDCHGEGCRGKLV